MRVLLTGAAGQLGQALIASQPRQLAGEPLDLIATSRTELDLADFAACRAAVLKHRPSWVLNAGAYTAVDRAESEPELAMAVNGGAPRAFAEALQQLGSGQLLQLSTDFVFNGGQGHPYLPAHPRRPLGVYGVSKAAGEEAVQELLGRGFILRTSWVYGPVGHNFCSTMLRLHRQRSVSGEPLQVVADQVGCPTSTSGLAAACWRVLGQSRVASQRGQTNLAPLPSILHWSDAGAASWYDFAVAIGELGVASGLLEKSAEVLPIMSVDYPMPAQRPSYSLLDCTASRQSLGLVPKHWRQALLEVLHQLAGR
jgi:dTDP-4-dehydrorhamnose reductase